MRLSHKNIVLLIVLALMGLASYEAYWLTGLYRDTLRDTRQQLTDVLVTADVYEMTARINALRNDTTLHGQLDFSQGLSSHSTTQVSVSSKSALFVNSDINKGTINSTFINVSTPSSEGKVKIVSSNPNDSTSMYAYSTETYPKSKDEKLNTYFFQSLGNRVQQAIHMGLNSISSIDFGVLDSMVHLQLRDFGLENSYRLEIAQYKDSTLKKLTVLKDTTYAAFDTLAHPEKFSHLSDVDNLVAYRLFTGPVSGIVFKKIAGILFSSIVLLLVLSLAFWFLIRTLYKQKAMDEMKTDFTNNITHELKTPISIAYAANDALLNFDMAQSPQKAHEYLQISQEQLRRLSGLVEQILSMSIERRQSLKLNKEQVDLSGMLRPMVTQYELKAEKPTRITLDIQPADLKVEADPLHLYNMIGNLIDNAIKYSPNEAVIHIRARLTAEGRVQIDVTDHGCGIAADKQPLVFERFYRVPTANVHNVKGYGLGLYYVKSLMEKHNGTVGLHSHEGEGSTFTLTF